MLFLALLSVTREYPSGPSATDLRIISSTLSLSSSKVLTMCCLYFSTSFMWSFRQRFLPWKREEVRRFTSAPQTSHFTVCMPHDMQILPTPMTMGNVPGVDSSFPHKAHFIILPVECCMAFRERNREGLRRFRSQRPQPPSFAVLTASGRASATAMMSRDGAHQNDP